MKMAKVLCATLVCIPLALEAGVAAIPQRSGSSAATADSAAGKNEADSAQQSSGSSGRNPLAVVVRGRGSDMPQRGVGQLAHSNADRLRALLGEQARGRVARQPARRPVGSAHAAMMDGESRVATIGGGAHTATISGESRAAAIGGEARQERLGAGSASSAARQIRQPTQAAASLAAATSQRAVRSAPTSSLAAVRSTNGVPRASGPALVGGPTIGRNVHNTAIDGTRLHNKL
jgi:hypothetical protein